MEKMTSHTSGVILDDSTIIVGLDASINETGLAILVKDQMYLTTVKPPKKMEGFRRCIYNAKEVADIVKSFRGEHRAVVYMEGYAMGIRGGKVFNIGENGGVIKADLITRGEASRIHTIPPMTLKKFISGGGHADKNVMMKRLCMDFGIDTDNDNEADAACLAIAGLAHLIHTELFSPFVLKDRWSSLARNGMADYKVQSLGAVELAFNADGFLR